LKSSGKRVRIRQIRAKDRLPMIGPQLVQQRATQRPLMHHALRVFSIDDLPRFPDATPLWQPFVQ
jgi:hypothetical protein